MTTSYTTELGSKITYNIQPESLNIVFFQIIHDKIYDMFIDYFSSNNTKQNKLTRAKNAFNEAFNRGGCHIEWILIDHLLKRLVEATAPAPIQPVAGPATTPTTTAIQPPPTVVNPNPVSCDDVAQNGIIYDQRLTIIELTSDNARLVIENERLLYENTRINNELRDIQNDNLMKDRELVDCQLMLATVQMDNNELQLENTRINNELRDMENLQHDIDNLQREIALLQNDNLMKDRELVDCQLMLATVQMDNNELRLESTRIEHDLDNYRQENARLRHDYLLKDLELTHCESVLLRVRGENHALRLENTRIDHDLDNCRQENARLRHDYLLKDLELVECQMMLLDLQAKNHVLQLRIDEQQSGTNDDEENRKLKLQLEECQTMVEYLRLENQLCRQTFDMEVEHYRTTINNLKQQINWLEENILSKNHIQAELHIQSLELNATILELRLENERQKNMSDQLKRKLILCEIRYLNLDKQNQALILENGRGTDNVWNQFQDCLVENLRLNSEITFLKLTCAEQLTQERGVQLQLQTRNDQLKGAIRQLQGDNRQLQTLNTRLEEAIHQLQQQQRQTPDDYNKLYLKYNKLYLKYVNTTRALYWMSQLFDARFYGRNRHDTLKAFINKDEKSMTINRTTDRTLSNNPNVVPLLIWHDEMEREINKLPDVVKITDLEQYCSIHSIQRLHERKFDAATPFRS